jgi:hypothetical protein
MPKPIVRCMDTYPNRGSRLAVFLSALYVVLLLLTPWILLHSALLLPPAASISAQATSQAASAVAGILKGIRHAGR